MSGPSSLDLLPAPRRFEPGTGCAAQVPPFPYVAHTRTYRHRSWNREAEEEVFQSWCAGRLVKSGQLQALLDRAATIEAFRRLGERSLRQHVLNQRERSQVQNLYSRAAELLQDDDDFASFVEAARPQDVW